MLFKRISPLIIGILKKTVKSMKITKESLEKRVDTDLIVSEDTYFECILDMVHLLYIELGKLLEEEGRLFGIMTRYMDIVQNAFDTIESSVEDETDYDLYGKCMYLYKPILFRAYKKLRKRKVSKADCIITISKLLLDYLRSSFQDTNHRKEVKSLQKITNKMYENIRNDGKKVSIVFVIEALNYFKDLGQIGLYPIDKFSIEDEEKKRVRTKLEGSGIRIDNKDSNILAEISWVEE